ncbi:MAG: DUF721 domain-containing protein [Pseudomonadota bacterium]
MADFRSPKPRHRGFQSASHLLKDRITQAGEKRGFAMSRLLTHWAEIVGEDLARMCEPVKVGYSRKGGLGRTLTVLIHGAAGPMVQTQSEVIRSRVNGCYGYNAISRVRFTQSSATPGFAEGQAAFVARPATPPQPTAEVEAATADVQDPALRAALNGLGARVAAKSPPVPKFKS